MMATIGAPVGVVACELALNGLANEVTPVDLGLHKMVHKTCNAGWKISSRGIGSLQHLVFELSSKLFEAFLINLNRNALVAFLPI